MEVNSIDEESLIPAYIHCFFSFSDLLFLGLPHNILGCSGFDAEVIDVGMILSVALIQIHAFNQPKKYTTFKQVAIGIWLLAYLKKVLPLQWFIM